MPQTTVLFEHDPERIKTDESHLPEQIVAASARRLKQLAMRMFGPFPRGQQDAPLADLLQQSIMRLRQALQKSPVTSTVNLFVIAAAQVRAELVDLAQHFSRPSAAPASVSDTVVSSTSPKLTTEPSVHSNSTSDADKLQIWTEFHSSIDRLPERERQAFDLIWYHDLTQREAASLLNIPERQLRRYWISARLKLHPLLRSFQLPELE